MKLWLLAFAVIAACALTLTLTVRQKVIPRFLASANEEMVADLHAGLTQCREETGSWPDPTDLVAYGAQVYVIQGADGRRIEGGYMHARPQDFRDGVSYDVFGQPMRVTLEGEHLLVASSGPDLTWGTADDVNSGQVREHYTPSTLAMARAAAEERAAKKK